MSDLYTSPEKYGLRPIGEVDFSDGDYQFDLTVVWQDVDTGTVYVADDAGCSCPVPFENTGRGDLRKITRTQELIEHFEGRKRESYDYARTESQRIDGQVGELITKVRAL